MQTPDSHLRGRGCWACAIAKQALRQRDTAEIFIQKAKEVYGDEFDYSLTKYITAPTKVDIICKQHNEVFSMTPNNHLRRAYIACTQCRSTRISPNKLSYEQVITNFKAHHGDLYDYSLVEYVNQITDVLIICRKHGTFSQTPNTHYRSGCPKCTHRVSKLETEWLDSIPLPNDQHHRQVKLPGIGGRKRVDGFNPLTNTVYEYYGDYWHGNPALFDPTAINNDSGKTFGELYKRTLNREQIIKSAGYNLITIWQSELTSLSRKTS